LFNRFWAVVAHGESDHLPVFVKFVEASYVNTVKGVVERDETSQTEGFSAVYAVSAGGISSAVQRARKELICQAVAEDADMVEVQLKTQFADSMAAVPTECRSLVPLTASADFRNKKKNYFRVLENVVSTRERESAMKPRVSPDFNGDRATIDVG
jgi:hypothetical protein